MHLFIYVSPVALRFEGREVCEGPDLAPCRQHALSCGFVVTGSDTGQFCYWPPSPAQGIGGEVCVLWLTRRRET